MNAHQRRCRRRWEYRQYDAALTAEDVDAAREWWEAQSLAVAFAEYERERREVDRGVEDLAAGILARIKADPLLSRGAP